MLLLVINLAPEVVPILWPLPLNESLAISAALYAGVLFLIYLQSKWIRPRNISRKKTMSLIANIELIGCFIFVYFFAGVQYHFPLINNSDTLLSAATLFLYLLGLGLFHYTSYNWLQAKTQINFLLPFLIPYFTLTVSLDLLSWLLGIREGWISTIIALTLLTISLLILPYFIQKFWNCTPLKDHQLHERLENLCRKARFTHGGMNTWSILPNAITAGIIGIIPPFRYVMFTPKLLQMLAPEQIEAILAHEIGHSKCKHLLLYPFIIFGMGVSVGLFFIFVDNTLEPHFYNYFSPHVTPLLIFIPYAVIMWLYFRYVFGFFSRLFERQADLYVFDLGIPPEHMISSLDHIAIASGGIHHLPSWHHFGIQERIDYLEKAIETPSLISRHHLKVKVCVGLYLIILTLGIFFLFWY